MMKTEGSWFVYLRNVVIRSGSEKKDLGIKDRRSILWSIGEMKMFKGIAREPISKLETYLKFGFVLAEHEIFYCPRCGHVLNAGPSYQPRHCDQCGQRVDFGSVEWKEDKEIKCLNVGEERGYHESKRH